MSATKQPGQAPLDDFDEGRALPPLLQIPALACELCGGSNAIVISSDVATLCIDCATSLSRLRPTSIPIALGALRTARRIHLMSIHGRPRRP